MTKEAYLKAFLGALEPLSDDERRQLRDYYEEMLCDGLEQGLTEEECVAQFGDPVEAAAQFREEYSQESGAAQQTESGLVPMNRPAGEFHTLNLTAEDLRIEVEPRREADFRIVFTPDPEVDLIESEERDGVWYFRHKLKKRLFRGLFGFFRRGDSVLTVQVPASFNGTLLIQTSNAKIHYSSIQNLPRISLISSNGSVEAENAGAEDFYCKTSNAHIRLTKLQALSGGKLEAVTSNGKIQGDGLGFGQVFCKTCNSGISFSQVSCENLEAQTSNGRVDARDCAASRLISLVSSNASVIGENLQADAITLTSSNGGISVRDLSGSHIALRTSNASITGTVRGDMREYATEGKTSNGSCNVPNLRYPDQQKDFSAVTSNGKIHVDFQP